MDMNLTKLRPPPPSQVQRLSKEGEEKDAEFLLLRLLNKRSRVRVSRKPLPVDSGKRVLFAVANETNAFAAVGVNETEQYILSVSPLSTLRSAFASTPPPEGAISLSSQRSVPLPGLPSTVSFAYHGQRLLVGLKDGQILVYDTATLLSGAGLESPTHIFPSPSGAAPRDILPNPGGIPELAAIIYDTDGSAGSLAVQILDVQHQQPVGGWLNGGSPETSPTAISWSPKGKQLAIGLLSGDIVTFSPTDTATIKTSVPRPSSLPSHCLISLSWLSNSDFHAIYVPSAPLTPDAPQTHLVLTIDSKANTSTEVQMSAPYTPFPGLCLPGSFPTVLRHWDPTKFLVFLGDSCSSDIGLMGSDTQQVWAKFNLEETSTPTVPLDDDMNDTVLIGLALDLTAVVPFQYKTVSGEDAEAPPPPVLYAYASDGTIVGWHIVNTTNSPYPGMLSTSKHAVPVSAASSMDTMKSNSESAQLPASAFPQPSAFGQLNAHTPTSAFGQPAFGQTTSVFGHTRFGQPSLSAASTPAFGQSSFGSPSAPKSGFGAFATGGPVAWGQGTSAFGSNALVPSTSVQSTVSPRAVSNSSSGEEAMATNGMADTGMGGLSLGTASESMDVTRPSTGRGTSGLFGSLSAAETPESAEEAKSTNAFGAIKPASGFGAFGSSSSSDAFGSGTSAFGSGTSAFVSSSAFSSGSPTDTIKPSSGFGATSFGKPATASAFGQSSFGQSSFGKPSFGQASFSAPSFGVATTPTPTTTSAFNSTGGGFSAFAQGGSAGFGVPKKDTETNGKPVWAGGDNISHNEEKKPTFGGGFGAFAQGGTTAFGLPTTDPATTGAFTTSPGAEEQKSKPSTSQFGSFSTPSPPGAPQPQPPLSEAKAKSEEQTAQMPSLSGVVGSSAFGSSLPAKPHVTADRSEERSTTPRTPLSEINTSTPASPVSTPAKVKEEPSTTPTSSAFTSSPFQSTTAGPTSGAFANLTANSRGFLKLDSGFGAFGGGVSTSSPFFKPPETAGKTAFGEASTTPASTPKSVFGAQSTPVSAFGKPGVSTPTSAFGAPSLLGTSGSAFGKFAWGTTPTTTPPVPPSSSASSAFSAFSGTPSGLSAFSSGSGSSKSFSDLLREAKDSPEAVKVSKVPIPAVPDEDHEKEDTHGTYDNEHAEEDEDETGSFLSQSFSEESVPEERDSDEQEEEQEDEQEQEEQEEEKEEQDEEEDEQELEESDDKVPDSPDQTPMPELPPPDAEETGPADESTPSIQFTSPSPPTSPAKKGKDDVLATGVSTTPPGSPAKSPSPPPVSSFSVASPVPVTPTSGPTGIGLGRPSTRPSRSSPLANAPILGDEGEHVELAPTSKSAPPLSSVAITPRTAPEKSVTQMPSPTPSSGDDQSPLASRSKTPPLPSTTLPKPSVFSIPPIDFGQAATPPVGPPPPATLPPRPAPTVATPLPGFDNFGRAKSLSPAPTFTLPPSSIPSTKASIFPGGFTGFGPKTSLPPPPLPTPASVFTPPDKSRAGTPPSSTFPPSNAFKLPSVPAPTGLFSGTPSPPLLPSSPKFSATPGRTTPSLPSGSLSLGQQAGPSVPPIQIFSSTSQNATPSELQETLGDLQRACLSVYNLAEQELKNVKGLADEATRRTLEYGKPTKVSKTKADLDDASKWSIGDVHEFARIMKGIDHEIDELQELRAEHRKSIRELESTMLRATTRKEEIIRFNKASTDAEFAKLLKSRTLGPEHLETQTQLRRQIRVIRDRVQTLEDHLQVAKKRLNEFKSGKPSVRAPSLGTINRTYRNIDLAVSQQAHDIAQLSTRVSRLTIDESRRKSTSPVTKGERRMPEDSIFAPDGRSQSTPPRDVTPNVAATTAAALNAERVAQKLKKALLKVRMEPLLNTQAVDAVSVPVDFQTPSKFDAMTSEAGSSSALFNLDNISFPTILQTPPAQIPVWNLPSFGLDEQEPPSPSSDGVSTRHRTHSGSKYHQRAVPLKKSPAAATTIPATSSAPASFNWGPLPGVKPKSTISIFDSTNK